MKKFLAFIFVFSLACGCAFCEIKAPEWKDVAPGPHVKVSTTEVYKMPLKQYWQTRRIKFEESVVACQATFEGELLKNCYDDLVQLEKSKNEMREQQLIERSRSSLFSNQRGGN